MFTAQGHCVSWTLDGTVVQFALVRLVYRELINTLTFIGATAPQ